MNLVAPLHEAPTAEAMRSDHLVVRAAVQAGGTQNQHNESFRLAVKTRVKAGDGAQSGGTNHNESLAVSSLVKAGGTQMQHNESFKLSTGLRAGEMPKNHNETLKLHSQVKAGKITSNHNESRRS